MLCGWRRESLRRRGSCVASAAGPTCARMPVRGFCCRCDSNDSVRPPGHSLQVALPNEPINNFEEHGDVRCDSSEDIFAVWLCEPVFMDPIIVDLLECNVQVGAVVAYP